MEMDFHHTAIYVICRLAGMKSIFAEKVAYASQQVDDAYYNHALKFKNGGVFHQTRTAHEKLSIFKMIDVNDAFNVWIPFHFIPSGDGSSITEALITSPESSSIELLKEEVIKAGDKEYALHWLGIFFHLYADAFSHQDFKGYYDDYNQIKVLYGPDKMSLQTRIYSIFSRLFAPLLPIGHAVAAKNPDISYAHWSYRRGEKAIEINNMKDRFIPAVNDIFEYILVYLTENPRFGEATDKSSLNRQFNNIINLFKIEDDYRKRHQKWLENIHNNIFDFCDHDQVDRELSYDKRGWFKKAVKTKRPTNILEWIENNTYNFYTFKKEKGFAFSDWTLFMRAAAIHKYRLLHKILPECGVDIG